MCDNNACPVCSERREADSGGYGTQEADSELAIVLGLLASLKDKLAGRTWAAADTDGLDDLANDLADMSRLGGAMDMAQDAARALSRLGDQL